MRREKESEIGVQKEHGLLSNRAKERMFLGTLYTISPNYFGLEFSAYLKVNLGVVPRKSLELWMVLPMSF